MKSDIIVKLGERIRDKRLEKGMTVQELGDKANISKSLLSKVENSRTVPSLPVFLGIVGALDMELKEFFESISFHNGNDYILIKKEDYTPFEKEGRKGFSYRLITEHSVQSAAVEIVLLEIDEDASATPSVTDGFEYKYLLSGEVKYKIGDQEVVMEAGDSILFDASKSHLPMNIGEGKAVMLVIYFLGAN